MKPGKSVRRVTVVVAILLWLFVVPGGISFYIDFRQGRDESLLQAAQGGEVKEVAALLAAGADPNAHEIEEVSSHGLWDHVGEVLAHSRTPNFRGARTVLACACESRHAAEVVQMLLDRGADVKEDDAGQQPALSVAVEKGNIAATRLLLQHGADVNGTNEMGMSPLKTAVTSDNPQLVQLLLGYGASVGGALGMSNAASKNYATIRQMIESASKK